MDTFEQLSQKQKAALAKARAAAAAKRAAGGSPKKTAGGSPKKSAPAKKAAATKKVATKKPRSTASKSPERGAPAAPKKNAAKKAAKKTGSPKTAKKAKSPKTGAVAKRSAIAKAAEKKHKIVIVAADGTLKRVGRSGAESALAAVKASGVSAAAVRSASKDMGMVLRKPKDKSRKLSAYHQHMRKYLKEHRAAAKKSGKCMSELLKEAVAAWTRTHGRKSKKTVGKTGAKKTKKAKKSQSPRK